ncbi:CDP-diacylglycerol--inositol 3-phosphatidyltransferase [Aspergillus terreus NIH2624]|uniref:CDP-diacylglycerol--inositol 3-phosphatidyltransferase n=1 Tax=Aspergillus terreus (strain NIH 2624 / FGSC A1156) TaxID=341663 RepID=Q0CM69_ASPTN|nr:CDP-diacylglycerol--inositol 3-phosphatidyltransferase [Aspergillus terreus NIH2624]EAU34284.1 CDP-diacylglycerol--inositol 3-phosphatidyltransferase [Aspergillus terreus NIH2624]KAG2420980.1 CDP-diacylglycerol--inositol 3-phosphatidyltransferase [Aspergillus terreus]
MAARTRRQKAALAAQSSGDESPEVNGTAQKSSPKSTKSTSRVDEAKENVYLFMPNLIGYCRVVLTIASLYYMPLHPRTCSILYSVSCLLDALDGYAARYYNQSTTFGAVLDMVTDRCTTACLLVFLSSAWPRWAIIFQGLIALDMASHYMHMYATLSMGGAGQSHKKIEASRSWILYQYYHSKTVLFICCALNEAFFIGLYLLSFSSPALSPSLLQEPAQASVQPGTSPTSIFTSPWSAGALEMARANKIDSWWPWVVTGISFPVMALKQIINVVQLVNASNWLVEGDIANRKAMRNGKN